MDEKVREEIDQLVKSNPVVLFMKGTPQFPQCGFSATVVKLLNEVTRGYKTVNVLTEPALREGVKEYSAWPTIPQLYVNGQFIGGCDIVKEMHGSGELHQLFGVKAEEAKAPAVSITERAARALAEAAKEAEGQPLRFSADERFQYDLHFAEKQPGDFEIAIGNLTLCTDRVSAKRVDGAVIDFVEGPRGAGFQIENPNAPPRVKPLSASELKSLLDRGEKLSLFDVRPDEERSLASLPAARSLDDAGKRHLLGLDRNERVVFLCHHGIRSRKAAESFLREGFRNLYNVEGGIDAWSLTVDPSVPRY